MTRPLRLELVVPVGAYGGAEHMVFGFFDHLAGRVEVSVTGLGASAITDAAAARGWPVRIIETGRRPVDIVMAVARAAAGWRRRDLDVVVANASKAAAVAIPAARLVGIPSAWMKHDFSHDATLSPWLGRLADVVVANSELTAAATARTDAVIVPPPRPAPALGPDEARARIRALGGPDGAGLMVAAIGRLSSYKGFDDLIAALAQRDAAGWTALIMGSDDPTEPHERRRLTDLAARLGVADRVVWADQVDRPASLLSGVDAVAVTTKVDGKGYGREGYSIVADEAMVAGTPLVVTEGGAVAARVGAAGIVVPMADPAAIASALSAWADPARRAMAAAAGRATVAAQPDLEECAGRFVAALASAARRPGAGVSDGGPISVVVPVYNEAATIDRTFRGLEAQLRDGDELVFACDKSPDGSGAVLDELAAASAHRCTVLHRDEKAGISAARNAGVEAAAHDLVALTDAGCAPNPGWLDGLRAGLAEHTRPDLVTGLYDVVAHNAVETAFALACYPAVDEARRLGPWTSLYQRLLGRGFDPTLPTGRSMAFRREAWRAAGGFPEHLATAEDVRFGRRLAELGRTCVLTVDAVTAWEQRPSLGATAAMYRSYGRGDGESGDRLLIGRNLVRLLAYLVGPAAFLAGGRWAKAGVVGAAGAYLSVPVARARRRRSSPAAVALVPVALAIKDVAKALGCLEGIAGRSGPPEPVESPA